MVLLILFLLYRKCVNADVTKNKAYDYDIDGLMCPSWLRDYKQLHDDKRNQNAKTITFVSNSGGDAGLGDRIRGVMWNLRAAMESNRVFFISITHPLDLRSVWEPNHIDWTSRTISGTNQRMGTNITMNLLSQSAPQHIIVQGGGFPFAPDPIIWSNKFYFNSSIHSPDYHCLFHFLFKPSAKLIRALDAEKIAKFGSKDAVYTSIQLRAGNLLGESNEVNNRGNDLYNLIGAFYCANSFSVRRNITATYLLSDDTVMRDAVRMGYFAGVNATGPSVRHAVHTKYKSGDALHFNTFVEMGMIGGGACIIFSRSGFNDMARWFGKNFDCIELIFSRYEHIHDGIDFVVRSYGPDGLRDAECFREFESNEGRVTRKKIRN